MRMLVPALLALLLSLQTASQAATNEAVTVDLRGSFNLRSDLLDGDGNRANVRLELLAHLTTLMGEPVVYCTGRWSLNWVNVGGRMLTERDMPPEVWRGVDLVGLNIAFPMLVKASVTHFDAAALPCDPGVFFAHGDRRAAFNVPGSPAWNRLLLRDGWASLRQAGEERAKALDDPTSYVSAEQVKAWLGKRQIGFDAPVSGELSLPHHLISGGVNLWSVRTWLQEQQRAEQAQLAAKRREKAAQAAAQAGGARSALDDMFADVEKTERSQETSRSTARMSEGKARALRQLQQRSARLKALQCGPARAGAVADETSLAEAARQAVLQYSGCDIQLAAFRDTTSRQYGYKSTDGGVRIAPQFSSARDFSEGRGAARDAASDRWGYVSASGQFAVSPQFADARPFSEGRAAVRVDKAGWGFIDREGRLLVPARFSEVSDFKAGRATATEHLRTEQGSDVCDPPVYVYRKGEIDLSGQWLQTPETVRDRGLTSCLLRSSS